MTGKRGGVIRRENKQNKKLKMMDFRNREVLMQQKTDPYNSVTLSFTTDLIISVTNRGINSFQFNSYTVLPGSILCKIQSF